MHRGIAWDDPGIGIQWALESPPLLSAKDRENPTLGALDPSRLPATYRERIERYFQKLSEK